MSSRIINYTTRMSGASIQHAKSDVLGQLYAEARARVIEERDAAGLKPLSDITLVFTVEQWCDDPDDAA